jgi:hypothetical protein
VAGDLVVIVVLLYGNLMIASVQLLETGILAAPRRLLRPPRPAAIPGLRAALAVTLAPLGPRLLPSPRPGRVGLICAWDDDASCSAFLNGAAAAPFAGGYAVRLRPTRVVGDWPPFGPLEIERTAEDDGPVAVLTLGRLRLRRTLPFLRASAAAETDVVASPALVLATGLARPPGVVGTFSLWRDRAEMRAVVEPAGGGHRTATAAHAADPFHHASAFIRFAPYGATGEWRPGIH